MENSTPDIESENSSGPRKRVGRQPKLHTQMETTETVEGFEQEQEEEELETMEDEHTGSASPTNLCRRSTRKKTVKFDVLDVLNKSRKTHKIQIEARIDSNAPTTTTTAPGTSSANRFVATRPLLPTVPPLSAIKLFTKPKPMPSLIVAQVSSDKTTVVKQEELPQCVRRRGRPRKNQAGEEVTGSICDVDGNKEEDISNPNWESGDSDESSKGLPVSFIVEESTNESSSAVLQETQTLEADPQNPTQVVLDVDSDSEIIFIDVDEAATQHEVVIEGEDNSSNMTEQQKRHFEFIIPKEQELEMETVSSNLATEEEQQQQPQVAVESELVTEVLSEPPTLWYTEEEVVEAIEQQEEQEKTAEASKLINEELTDLVTSLHVQDRIVEQVEQVQPVEIHVEENNMQEEAEIVAEMKKKLSIGEERGVLHREATTVSMTESSPTLPAQIEPEIEKPKAKLESQLKPEPPQTKSDSPARQLPQAEPLQIETVSLSLLPEAATTDSKIMDNADKESVASTSKAAAVESEKKKGSNSPTSRQEKPSSSSSVVECDALFKALDKADAQLRHEEKAKKKLKPSGKKQTTAKQETPRQSPSTPPVRSKKQQAKKSSRRNTISEEHHEPESTLSVTNKRRNSLHPFKASQSPERQQPETDAKLGKKASTKKPPRKATGAAKQLASNQDSLDSQPSRSITTTPTCEQQQQQEEPNPLQDIAKFIEDGVKLLERDYKLEDEQQQQQQQLTEDELAQRVANLETPAATPTPSPAVSTEDLSHGVRRSHRIKQKPQSSSKSNATSRANSSNSNTPSISMEQQLSELATVEQINEQFLRQEGLHTFQTLRDNYYRCARQVSKENAEMQCDCFVTGDEAEGLGQVPCGDGCINRMLMIECGPLCTNGERCTNKRFQQHQGWPCRVFRTEKKGCGITAELQIPPGEFIMEYVGEVIDSEEFERRQHLYSEDRNRHYYFMALRGEAIIDATSRGNISRYINHSCDPNAETQKWTVNGELRIGFFSLKTILPGEEITFDYQYQRYGRDAQRCYCESSNCRGWIGNEPESDEGEQLDTESDSEVESQEDEQQLEQEQEQKAKAAKSSKSKLESKLPVARRKGKEQHGVRSKEREYKAGRWLRPTGPGSGEKSASGKHDHIEDPDVLEQLTLLSRSGLKNQLDTLRFSRCMVRAKLLQSRLQLLGVLTRGELPCRRLFLDYHGLRLLHAWISEGGSDRQLRLALLEALESLPIPNKTMLNDSRVYQCVQEWSTQPKEEEEEEEAAAADPNPNPDLTQRILALLQKWNGLPEIFRIPKRERIEQMKEHEREADRQQLELESNSASSLLSSDRYKQDRFRRDTSSRYEKGKPPSRMSGNNTICTITTQPSSIDGAKLESRRRLEYEPRRTITKEQRRSLFEKKVAQDEAEKRVGSEDWREHELRCEYFGSDLNTDRKLLPFYQNTETNEWFNGDDMPVPAPLRYGDPAAPPSPESIDEVEYKLPAGVEPLPPSWHWSMTPEGDIYYYNLRDRIPQWEPPSAEQRLQQLVEDSPITEPEPVDEALSDLEMVNIDIDCGSTLSAKSLAQYIEVKIRERREMRRNRLVSVRMISPRREEDRVYNQAESRKYKENKEKIRRRKEIYRRTRNEANNPEQPTELEPGDSLPIHRYLYSSDEEAADDGSIFSVAPLDTTLDGDGNASRSSSTDTDSLQSSKRKFSPSEGHKRQRIERDKKRKTNTTGRDASAKFHFEISGHVAELLRPYRQETCQLGRITSDEDYKFLIKRLSHHITTKEMRYCDMTGNPLAYTESVKHKSYDFIKQYMRKKGPVYKKPVDRAD